MSSKDIQEEIIKLKKTLNHSLEYVESLSNNSDNLSSLLENANSIQEIINKIIEKRTEKNDNMIKTLVLSGGGIKGLAYIGVFKALEELDYIKNISTYIGVSIGSILAALYIIGYDSKSLYEFSLIFPFHKLINMEIGNIYDFGLDDGEKLVTMIKEMFISKKISIGITFKELYEITKKKLILTTACINDKKPYYLSYENYPDLSVIKALRMSMSVPIYFTPVELENKLFVDGGCCDNFPIHLIKNPKEVLGLCIKLEILPIKEIDSLDVYLIHLIQTILNGVIINEELLKDYDKSIIKFCINIDFMDLDLNEKKRIELFELGYNLTINKFKK